MLVQNFRTSILQKVIKFQTLDEYLEFINSSNSWKENGFEWYCKISPVLFYINEHKKELKIEGPHIVELCNNLVRSKSDKGDKVRFITTEADWKFNLSIDNNEFTAKKLKEQLDEWNKLIQDAIDSKGLNTLVIKQQRRGLLWEILK